MIQKVIKWHLLASITLLIITACRIPFTPDTRPNFLIIITDDQRFDTLPYMPNTQKLIFDQGVTFSHGYVTTPFCCPSRSSIFTGLYAHNHKVLNNKDKLNFPTLVNDLQDNGYFTGLVGKYLNSWNGEARPEFDYWVSFFGGTVLNYYDPKLNINGKWSQETGYMTYLFEDHVITYLDQATRQNKPFFLIFAPNAPHAPYTPLKEDKTLYTDLPPYRPPSFNEEDLSDKPQAISRKPVITAEAAADIENTRHRQILTLTALDRSIGNIINKLSETGELDNTFVLFISDNGIHWGEHRMDTKSTAYEESVRVPFAIRYPPLIPSPYVEASLVANIDIAPTIYELSETTAPWVMDGMSLVSLFQHTGTWRDHILLEAWPDRGHWSAIHTGDMIYIETENDLSEFYDLTTDPYQLDSQLNNPEYQAVITRLKELMQKETQPRTIP